MVEVPVGARVVIIKELDRKIEFYSDRDDEQGKLILRDLKQARAMFDGQ